MAKNLILFGCGGHAKVIIDLIEHIPHYRLFGLIDDDPNRSKHFQGYPILGDTSCISKITAPIHGGLIAIGDNWSRKKVADKIKRENKEFPFIVLIHPTAYISPRCDIGAGTVIMAGAIVNSDVKMGEHCIVNTLGSVAHDTVIGDYSSVGPGAHLGGNTILGMNTAISIGARVLHGTTIGSHTVIGAGATVTKDFEDYVVAYGTPAKFIRKREKDETYL
ncbi:acetyltransferase [Jeotgalibacillus sp. S-D1]|uniref:acetyltransferase n=1 Tax=Jeotgalibacillus sp. S-D1 TaxID=2552189 RepID=UPI0010594FE0|nr:acetyltransferase [Jeotgalibacillus sp. S-D1]TDL32512.1 acetyltransferase [Jeotgalibacillus sp. S-D1]